MSELVEVAKTSDVPLGKARAYDAAGRRIALYHTEQGFFATDNQCPHRGGPLAEGDLMGMEITCPWHLWGFDVRSGECGGNPDLVVATHPVSIEGDRVMVMLP